MNLAVLAEEETPIEHVITNDSSKEIAFMHHNCGGRTIVFTITAQYANGAPVDLDIDFALTDIVSHQVGEAFTPEAIATKIRTAS